MMSFTNRNLVAFALVAIASLAFFSTGCSRDEEPREDSQPSAQQLPEVEPALTARMADPTYVKALDERRAAQSEIEATRYRLVRQMEAKIAEAKTRLGTEDEDVLKVELEKDPEWNSLYDRVVDLNKALDDERKRAASLVRERIFADQRKGLDEK